MVVIEPKLIKSCLLTKLITIKLKWNTTSEILYTKILVFMWVKPFLLLLFHKSVILRKQRVFWWILTTCEVEINLLGVTEWVSTLKLNRPSGGNPEVRGRRHLSWGVCAFVFCVASILVRGKDGRQDGGDFKASWLHTGSVMWCFLASLLESFFNLQAHREWWSTQMTNGRK